MIFAQQQLWHVLVLSLYTVAVAIAALAFEWSTFLALTVLFVPPLLLLAYEKPSLPPALFGATVLATLGCLSVAVFGQAGGLWYDLSTATMRPFGVAPEYFLFALVHTLYTLVLYEFLFDDAEVRPPRRSLVTSWGMVTAVLLVSLWYLHAVLVVSFAFAWLLLLLLLVLGAVVALSRQRFSASLLRKILVFSTALFPVWLTVELLAMELGVRVYAFPTEYVRLLSIGNATVPVEELVLLWVWPVFTVVLYELFFDDGR